MNSAYRYAAPSRTGKISLTIWTDPARRDELKIAAIKTGKSVQKIVEKAIDAELKRLSAGSRTGKE